MLTNVASASANYHSPNTIMRQEPRTLSHQIRTQQISKHPDFKPIPSSALFFVTSVGRVLFHFRLSNGIKNITHPDQACTEVDKINYRNLWASIFYTPACVRRTFTAVPAVRTQRSPRPGDCVHAISRNFQKSLPSRAQSASVPRV